MELWDLYTDNRIKTGKTMIRGEEQPEGYFREVVHICIFNDKGEMLIQQRQPFKKDWSGLWDITVGGCAVSGDGSRHAAHRELLEEIGLDISFENVRPVLTVHFDKGFDDIYIIEKNIDVNALNLQYDEVKCVQWATLDTILQMIKDEIFIPYHSGYIEWLFFLKDRRSTVTRQDISRTGENNQ